MSAPPLFASPLIAVVEPDDAVASALTEQIRHGGRFRASRFASVEAAAAADPAILVSAVAQDFRTVPCPVVALCQEGAESPSGSAARLDKPVRIAELLAALEATMAAGPGEVPIGPMTFRPQDKLLRGADGQAIRLTEKEAAILGMLVRSGEAVDRDTMLREVWGYRSEISTHTVETHVYRLRRKLEDSDGSGPRLLTEAGGYRLIRD